MEETRVQTTSTRITRYKGISGAIRSAVIQGKLEGKLTPLKIRKLLTLDKPSLSDAPSNVIYKSLKYLVKRKELQMIGDSFYPVSYEDPATNSQVIVTGRLLTTEVVNGQLCAKVAIDQMEVQK